MAGDVGIGLGGQQRVVVAQRDLDRTLGERDAQLVLARSECRLGARDELACRVRRIGRLRVFGQRGGGVGHEGAEGSGPLCRRARPRFAAVRMA